MNVYYSAVFKPVSRELKIRNSGFTCWLIPHITIQLYLVSS